MFDLRKPRFSKFCLRLAPRVPYLFWRFATLTSPKRKEMVIREKHPATGIQGSGFYVGLRIATLPYHFPNMNKEPQNCCKSETDSGCSNQQEWIAVSLITDSIDINSPPPRIILHFASTSVNHYC